MKKILSLILVFAGLFVLGLQKVNASDELFYLVDFESAKNGSYVRSGETDLGVVDGEKWSVTTTSGSKSGILWNYIDYQDTNITEEQGKNIGRIDGRNTTTLTSFEFSYISKFEIDAKVYGTTDGALSIYTQIGNEDRVLVQKLDLTAQFKTFSFDINLYNVKIIIEGTGERTNIDNIKVYSLKQFEYEVITVLDSENISEVKNTAKYGDTITLSAEAANYNFAFWVVNGVVRRDLTSNEQTFIVKEGLSIQQVFYPEGKHAVLFIDSNGKLIDVQYVANGEAAVAPSVEDLSKPGYTVSQENPWLDHKGLNTLENIDYSRVYTLQYEKTNNAIFTITVDGVENTYEYNELATITSEDPLFTHWESDGKVVSTNRTYTFTVVENKVFTAKTTEIEQTTRIIMTDDLKVRENYQTFIAQIDLLEGEIIVENGYVLLEDGLQKNNPLTLESKDVIKVQSNVLNQATNEFTYSFQEIYAVVRAYVVTKDAEGKLNTYYSENQYSNGVVVTLDIDGKIEKTFHLLGTTFAQPVQPSKDRMNFAGWFVGEEEFDFAAELSKDITIEAKFNEPTDEQKVQYAKEDLFLDTEDYRNINLVTSGTYGAVITWVSSDINVIDNAGQLINRPADADVVITLTATITIGEFILTKEFTVLVPKAVAQQWTVSFETNGGTELEDILVDDQGFITEPENIVKDGYTFVGWYLDENFTNKYSFSNPITENIILYAKWEEELVSKTFTWTLVSGEVANLKTNNNIVKSDVKLIWTWSTGYNTALYTGFDGAKGGQIGSSSQPAEGTITFKLDLPENAIITGYTVNASIASGGDAKFIMHDGVNKTLTTSNAAYGATNLNISNNNFSIGFSNTVKAFYIKSIVINFKTSK